MDYAGFLSDIFDLGLFNNSERKLLYQFSIMPSSPVPYRDGVGYADLLNILGISEDSRLDIFPEMLSRITRLGWVKQIGYAFQMHPLLQEIIRSKKSIKLIEVTDMIQSLIKLLNVSNSDNPVLKVPLLEYSESVLRRHKYNIRDLSVLSNMHSAIHMHLADWQEALVYQRISYLYKKKDNKITPNPAGLSMTYSNLSLIYKALGRIKLSLRYAEKDLEIKHENNITGMRLAKSYNSIAILYEDKMNYSKALHFHLKSLELKQKACDEGENELLSLSTTYNNISLVYSKLGTVDGLKLAFSYQEKAITIRERELEDKSHYMFAQSYGNYADLLLASGRIAESLKYNLMALKSHKAQSKDNSRIAISLLSLSLTLLAQGRFDKALIAVRNATRIRRINLQKAKIGNIHASLAEAYKVYSKILLSNGKKSASLFYIDKCIEIIDKLKLNSIHKKEAYNIKVSITALDDDAQLNPTG